MTSLAASSSLTHLRVRLRPASLPSAPLARPDHRQRQWPEHQEYPNPGSERLLGRDWGRLEE
jgi:hypothetical protein